MKTYFTKLIAQWKAFNAYMKQPALDPNENEDVPSIGGCLVFIVIVVAVGLMLSYILPRIAEFINYVNYGA